MDNLEVVMTIIGLAIGVLVIGAIISVLTALYKIIRVAWWVFTTPVRVLWRFF